MATVDLSDLIPDLTGAITIPGTTSRYSNASDTEWLTKLRNGFWTAYNDGVISGFTCDEDGIVSASGGGDATFSRDLQQIVIMYSAINILQMELLQIKTTFRAKAGPVEYETQQSAQVLQTLLASMLAQRTTLLDRLSDIGATDSYYVDGVKSRDLALRNYNIDWNG